MGYYAAYSENPLPTTFRSHLQGPIWDR